MLAIVVGAYFWQGLRHHVWGWSILGVLGGFISAGGIWQTLTNGEARTNHGWLDPETRPVAYWLTVTLTFGLYAGFVVPLFFTLPSGVQQ